MENNDYSHSDIWESKHDYYKIINTTVEPFTTPTDPSLTKPTSVLFLNNIQL